jgi:hypothetical protein
MDSTGNVRILTLDNLGSGGSKYEDRTNSTALGNRNTSTPLMKPKRQLMKSKSIAKLPWAFQSRLTPLQHSLRDTSLGIIPTKATVMVKSLPKVIVVKNNTSLSKAQSMRRNVSVGGQLCTSEQAIANSTVLGAEKNLKTLVQLNNVQQRNKEEKKVRR